MNSKLSFELVRDKKNANERFSEYEVFSCHIILLHHTKAYALYTIHGNVTLKLNYCIINGLKVLMAILKSFSIRKSQICTLISPSKKTLHATSAETKDLLIQEM